MIHHKLVFEEDLDEDYILIAIHCGEDDYKLAFLLNQHLNLRFRRKPIDLDFSTMDRLATFPLFDYEDDFQYSQFHLVSNKCTSIEAELQSAGGLFSEVTSEKYVITYLIPEFKDVNYFLKIYSDYDNIELREFIIKINEIKQVVSAYEVDINQIKSKNNLIFN